MATLLVVESSIQGERSVSRGLTRRAVDVWRRAHPEGAVVVRDLVEQGPAHLSADGHLGRLVPEGERTEAQALALSAADRLAQEVRDATTVILGVPLYNWNVPTTVKAWVDHLLLSSLIRDPQDGSRIAGLDVVLVVSRGGSYGPGTPREGWDHATPWLLQVFESVGVTPRVVAVEMTLAEVNPALARFKEFARQSRAAAERAIDELWPAAEAAAV